MMRIKGTRIIAPISAALAILTLILAAASRYSCAPLPRFFVLPTFIASLISCVAAAIIMFIEGKRTGKYAGKKYFVFSFCVNGFLVSALIINAHINAQWEARVNNLKAIYAVLEAYAYNNMYTLPPIDNVKNNFIFDANVLYPEHMSDLRVLACPSDPNLKPEKAFRLRSTTYHPDSSIGDVHPDCVTGDGYCYLGWLLTSDEEAEMFFEAYDLLAADQYDYDFQVPEGRGNPIGLWFGHKDNVRGDMIHRLSMTVDAKLMSEAAIYWIGSSPGWISSLPIMWEKEPRHESPFQNEPPPALVLYMDGHVESIRFGERFPMTETMARLLGERKREPIPDCDG